MKEKIIEFANGRFVYERPRLRLEPDMLKLELSPGEDVEGSFVVGSLDGRRVKGFAHTRIPGLELKNECFFARNARIEFAYLPRWLEAGEEIEGSIWLETSAGEYTLPVSVRIREAIASAEKEEVPLPPLHEPEKPQKSCPKGKGRTQEWIQERQRTAVFAGFQSVIEKLRRSGCTFKEASSELRTLVDRLLELEGESAVYLLLDAYVLLLENRRKEAGWILRKYEKIRQQQKTVDIRALYLYVDAVYQKEQEAMARNVSHLQKLYKKHPKSRMVTAALLELDPKLKENVRTRYLLLKRQFRFGVRNRLLYQAAWETLKGDLALLTELDAFDMQAFGWAAFHGLLTAQAAQAAAEQASRVKYWSPAASRLLEACYQANPSKETAGAVCAAYIRGNRTDAEAFLWYQKGVELDAKITNLYEYFMYALPKDYEGLLPRPVLLYFQYHNTLSDDKRTTFYCNLVKYGSREELEGHRRQLDEFLLKQLMMRRISEPLSWLYGKCLLVETLEEPQLSALADLLFLRKLTCKEKRIRQVEMSYAQLEKKIMVPLSGGIAYIPVYTPDARISLLDGEGNHYQKTISYNVKRILVEPRLLQVCTSRLKNHTGLNLFLLDGKGPHKLRDGNVETAYRLVEDEQVEEGYRRRLKVELLEYERSHGRLEKAFGRLQIPDAKALSRSGQAVYLESLIVMGKDAEAFALLNQVGGRKVDPKLLLCFLERLLAEGKASEKALVPFAYQVFDKGIYTERILELLERHCEGSMEELLRLWEAAMGLGKTFPELEERLCVQALFTERMVEEAFPVFVSMDNRGGDSSVCAAYLNYVGWLDFVKGQQVPKGLCASLESHLYWQGGLCEAAVLSYLKGLSGQEPLTKLQKGLAQKLMEGLAKKRQGFSFMRRLLPNLDRRYHQLEEQTVVEYRCNPEHRVVLHYILESHGKPSSGYSSERLYPICGGVFIRSFLLFYGERLTWYFTEESEEEGLGITTESQMIENFEEPVSEEGRYQKLCLMQRALDCGQDQELRHRMGEYKKLDELIQEQFARK